MNDNDIIFDFGPALALAQANEGGVVRKFVECNYYQLEILSFEHSFKKLAKLINQAGLINFKCDFQFTAQQLELCFEVLENEHLYDPHFQQWAEKYEKGKIEDTLRKAVQQEDMDVLADINLAFARKTFESIDDIEPRASSWEYTISFDKMFKQVWTLKNETTNYVQSLWQSLKT